MPSLITVLENRNLFGNIDQYIQEYAKEPQNNQKQYHEILNFIKQWTFRVNNRPKTRFGCCRYRDRVIEVSGFHWYHGKTEDINKTILHEVAHLLALHLYSHSGHGRIWKHIMRKLGVSPQRCGSYSSQEAAAARPKYEYKCADCGTVAPAYKRWRRQKYHATCQFRANGGNMILAKQNY